MRVLVLYGSRYGSTKEIAQRIAQRLRAAGLQVDIETATYAGSIDVFDAFVIGSAAYMGSWLKEPADWVRGHAQALAGRPVWLFSSGPLGTRKVDDEGKDLREATVPKEFAEFDPALKPRGSRVFFGALDHKKLGLAHRMVWSLPAGRKLLIEGDFRDWDDIDGWATGIAEALEPAPVP
jgi:menaquinone-dependent protoporphyrinogen oxidase